MARLFGWDTCAWKAEHEQGISNSSDRTWIRPANSIEKFTEEGQTLQFSYWIDLTDRPRLFTPQQLAILNVLMSLNLMLHRVGMLPERLQEARGADVAAVLQQEWTKIEVETSVVADLCQLLAMAGNVTFAEFLGFMIQGHNATGMIQAGARRIEKLKNGEEDPIVKNWFKSDLMS